MLRLATVRGLLLIAGDRGRDAQLERTIELAYCRSRHSPLAGCAPDDRDTPHRDPLLSAVWFDG